MLEQNYGITPTIAVPPPARTNLHAKVLLSTCRFSACAEMRAMAETGDVQVSPGSGYEACKCLAARFQRPSRISSHLAEGSISAHSQYRTPGKSVTHMAGTATVSLFLPYGYPHRIPTPPSSMKAPY